MLSAALDALQCRSAVTPAAVIRWADLATDRAMFQTWPFNLARFEVSDGQVSKVGTENEREIFVASKF